MTNEPFFTIEGTHYVPTPTARGPWNPNSLHGRVIAGLLGAEIERRHGDPDFLPAAFEPLAFFASLADVFKAVVPRPSTVTAGK